MPIHSDTSMKISAPPQFFRRPFNFFGAPYFFKFWRPYLLAPQAAAWFAHDLNRHWDKCWLKSKVVNFHYVNYKWGS